MSGLTVAVVALPLSMAIAIASGVSPERGLYTAIAGGLIISLLAAAASRSAARLVRLLALLQALSNDTAMMGWRSQRS